MSAKSPIGRFAKIKVGNVVLTGNVIDAIGINPKRIRIQTKGDYHGKVYNRGEYIFQEFV